MKNSFFFLLAAALTVACKPQESATAQQPSPVAITPTGAASLVQLELGACRGYCPVYKLDFHTDGTLDYVGIRNVEKEGSQTVRLSTEEYAKLLKEVLKVDLWQYPSDIQSTVVDAPIHTITVFEGEKSHTVKGRAGIPKPIMDLEMLMKDIAEAHGIAVKKGVDPNDPSKLKGRAIVQFKMDVNAGNFCMQFSDLKIRPIQHLSEDNTWIIGYNPSEINAEQFTSLLKDMDGVLTVTPEKQVKERQ